MRERKERNPFEELPFSLQKIIKNEGATVEKVPLNTLDEKDELFRIRWGELPEPLVESIKPSGL